MQLSQKVAGEDDTLFSAVGTPLAVKVCDRDYSAWGSTPACEKQENSQIQTAHSP